MKVEGRIRPFIIPTSSFILPPMSAYLQPVDLDELFPVFTRVEAGESILLGAPDETAVPMAPPSGPAPCLGVRSSGSTGLPKVVWRPWAELSGEVRVDDRTRGWRWASPFSPSSFAGVQVALQAWRGGGSVRSLNKNWADAWANAGATGWDAISATPTYLDLLVQNEPLEPVAADPRHITLGGEVLRPALGERLRSRFPNTSFTVIYASAEFGVLLKTHRVDGWYEAQALSHRHHRWRVNGGGLELEVNGVWQATGDAVEERGDLLRVVGRGDRVANVAGSKVNLDEVARHAEEVPGVRRALAYAEPSAVTGQVVCLRFAPAPGTDPEAVRAGLETHLRNVLVKPAWPRRWEIDALLPGRNAKRGT